MSDLPTIPPDKRQLKSYVWHHESGKCFFVSTIERPSSAAEAYNSMYMETMAWEYDWEKAERGECVVHTGDGQALDQHFAVVKSLFKTGTYDDSRD